MNFGNFTLYVNLISRQIMVLAKLLLNFILLTKGQDREKYKTVVTTLANVIQKMTDFKT